MTDLRHMGLTKEEKNQEEENIQMVTEFLSLFEQFDSSFFFPKKNKIEHTHTIYGGGSTQNHLVRTTWSGSAAHFTWKWPNTIAALAPIRSQPCRHSISINLFKPQCTPDKGDIQTVSKN